MICDFHSHSSLSDGALSPLELIHRAFKSGYRAIAITDHTGAGSLQRIIAEIAKDCALAEEYWDIIAVPGVELTHVPAPAIPILAKQAKEMGAQLVLVHGETIVEPVPEGTNLAAVQSPHVDVLAHPGLLSSQQAALAAANDIFIEISARNGHSLTNGHVARITYQANAKLLLNSDAHEEGDLLRRGLPEAIAQAAGLPENEIGRVLEGNPAALLSKLHKL